MNIIGKAAGQRRRDTVLELFKTRDAMPLRFDDPCICFLYANGVIERQQKGDVKNTVRFSSPFVRKRLFNYFSREIFRPVRLARLQRCVLAERAKVGYPGSIARPPTLLPYFFDASLCLPSCFRSVPKTPATSSSLGRNH